jgi:hypothetical protein
MRNWDFGNVGSEILANLHVFGAFQHELLAAYVLLADIWKYVSPTPNRWYGYKNLSRVYQCLVGMNIIMVSEIRWNIFTGLKNENNNFW